MNQKEIIDILKLSSPEDLKDLRAKINTIKERTIKNSVFFRGLLELSNVCHKDCHYCGIRQSNKELKRYFIATDEALESIKFAYEMGYGSVVIQTGENRNRSFIKEIDSLLQKIGENYNGKLKVTLSCGEHDRETLKRWKALGADRYLLRIETTSRDLYYKIHPKNNNHSFLTRIKTLLTLKELEYQVGTGNMVALPNQTLDDIANDLLFFKKLDVDMVGLGPYIPHSKTPLYEKKDEVLKNISPLQLTFNTIAALRILMPSINIASATALQSIDPAGREKALQYGANIIMPNITPQTYRDSYLLYENKPCTDETPDKCKGCLEARVKMFGHQVTYNQSGDSLHFLERI